MKANSRLWAAMALLVLVIGVGWNPLGRLFELARSNQEYTHVLLIVPVVVAFLVLELPRGRLDGRSSPLLGVVLGVGAVILRAVSHKVPAADGGDLTLAVAALVLAVWATVCMVYGWSFFRAALFPMLFLLLVIPLPLSAVAWLTETLQTGSTIVSYLLFKACGVPVTRDGFLLILPRLDIEVAKECSGIRSTVMLFIAALVLGQWYLRTGWRKVLLALIVLPVGIVRNSLRIFILSMLGSYVDEGWLDGNLHHRGGIVFFVIGLSMILGLLWLLKLGEREAQPVLSSTDPGLAVRD